MPSASMPGRKSGVSLHTKSDAEMNLEIRSDMQKRNHLLVALSPTVRYNNSVLHVQ